MGIHRNPKIKKMDREHVPRPHQNNNKMQEIYQIKMPRPHLGVPFLAIHL